MSQATVKHRRALVWFTQDLRIHDNATLTLAHQSAEAVMHVCFIKDLLQSNPHDYFFSPSDQRKRFLYEALADLKSCLEENGHDLLIIDKDNQEALADLITQYDIEAVYRTKLHGFNERQDWGHHQNQYENVVFIECESYSLYTQQSLPFPLSQLPNHFTAFRKIIEADKTCIRAEIIHLVWAKPIQHQNENTDLSKLLVRDKASDFIGGVTAANLHLADYFSSDAASSYKDTRNALMGFGLSTKFSPWLAQGSLSVVQIMQALIVYEQQHGKNQSTYWIYFELLWREYFYWLAMILGRQLFLKKGLRLYPPKTNYAVKQFQQWLAGATDWPIVNACMHELAATGYMSNRGRQLVASCLINELALDWRYGAAYFESQLIDYDVGSNWCNWQYLAGVGVDPRGQRRFDLSKQANIYDPNGDYIRLWNG